MERPVIGISIGDPAGIGPEIALKALKNGGLYKICKPLVIGNFEVLRKIEGIVKTGLMLSVVTEPEYGKYSYGTIDIISLDHLLVNSLEYGKLQALAGRAAYEFLAKALEFADKNKIDATVSAPLNMDAVEAAGIDFENWFKTTAALSDAEGPVITHFEEITFVRGTAFEIAGKGVASPADMEEAIRLAAEYSRESRK